MQGELAIASGLTGDASIVGHISCQNIIRTQRVLSTVGVDFLLRSRADRLRNLPQLTRVAVRSIDVRLHLTLLGELNIEPEITPRPHGEPEIRRSEVRRLGIAHVRNRHGLRGLLSNTVHLPVKVDVATNILTNSGIPSVRVNRVAHRISGVCQRKGRRLICRHVQVVIKRRLGLIIQSEADEMRLIACFSEALLKGIVDNVQIIGDSTVQTVVVHVPIENSVTEGVNPRSGFKVPIAARAVRNSTEHTHNTGVRVGNTASATTLISACNCSVTGCNVISDGILRSAVLPRNTHLRPVNVFQTSTKLTTVPTATVSKVRPRLSASSTLSTGVIIEQLGVDHRSTTTSTRVSSVTAATAVVSESGLSKHEEGEGRDCYLAQRLSTTQNRSPYLCRRVCRRKTNATRGSAPKVKIPTNKAIL